MSSLSRVCSCMTHRSIKYLPSSSFLRPTSAVLQLSLSIILGYDIGLLLDPFTRGHIPTCIYFYPENSYHQRCYNL